MKKSIALLVFMLCVAMLHAQSTHMKFMGIPLNGTITNFQSQLKQKGVSYDSKTSLLLATGCRAFKGVFSGEKADIYIYYDVKSKIVYRAKVVITCLDEEKWNYKYNDFKRKLITKYENAISEDGSKTDFPSFSMLIPKADRGILGGIDIYATKPDYSFMREVYLHIDYVDYANDKSHEDNSIDDL